MRERVVPAARPRSRDARRGPTPHDGAVLFARYAYPPNARGYCGPDAATELLELASATGPAADDGLRRLARGFEGAWPYLELIASAHGIADPLDRRVVEAYWIGNDLLHLPGGVLVRSLEERFRARLPRLGPAWEQLTAPLTATSPHHSFHVLGVYPWVGLLREGHVEALEVLDRCRVRWGRVLAVTGEVAVVRSRPLVWDGRLLVEGPARPEEVRLSSAGYGLAGVLEPGDWCSMHWDWVCERLDRRRLAALRLWSGRQLDAVNAAPVPGPARVLA